MRRLALRALFGIAIGVAAAPASAHVVYDRTTLRQWCARSERVLVAELVAPLRIWTAPDGSDRQEFYAVRVLETLKGEPVGGTIEFFPHVEGGSSYRPGDRALVFLEPTASRPELLSLAPRFPWYSLQDAGQEWVIRPDDGGELRALARSWLDVERGPGAEETARTRALLARSLRSPDPRVRADAVAELVRAREITGFFASVADVAPFAKRAREPGAPVADRIALALLLQDRPGFDAAAALRALTKAELSPPDRVTLIRVAGAVPDDGLSRWIEGQLRTADPTIRAEAATALGRPHHAARVASLAKLLGATEPSVAGAAVRGLQGIATPEARAALEGAALAPGAPAGPLADAALRQWSVSAPATPHLAPSSNAPPGGTLP